MRIGIIAEGPADVAVLTNVLRGALAIDSEAVRFLRPDLQADETDAHTQAPGRFSNFETVIEDCQQGELIEDFLTAEDEEGWVVVHLDAAEHYRITFAPEVLAAHPEQTPEAIRQRLCLQLARWLAPRHLPRICRAIAVHEMDAWVLPLFDEKLRDTSAPRDAKGRLADALQRQDIDEQKYGATTYARRLRLSKDLARRKHLQRCAERNFSLRLFLDELQAFLAPPSEPPEP